MNTLTVKVTLLRKMRVRAVCCECVDAETKKNCVHVASLDQVAFEAFATRFSLPFVLVHDVLSYHRYVFAFHKLVVCFQPQHLCMFSLVWSSTTHLVMCSRFICLLYAS